MIEAPPGTNLRKTALSLLFRHGFAGPNYCLDDVSAYVERLKDGRIKVEFWDMTTYTWGRDEEKLFDEFGLLEEGQ